MLAYVGLPQNLKDLKDQSICTGGPDVIRKKHSLSTKLFPVSAYIGSSKNLKDLKHLYRSGWSSLLAAVLGI